MSNRIVNRKAPKKGADFYETPRDAILKLIENESFDGGISEPACGKGAISRVMIEKGYRVNSSDLFSYGYGKPGVDFLVSKKKVDNLITNPPFNLALEFTKQATSLTMRKVALLMRIQFLEGKERGEFFKHTPPRESMSSAKESLVTKRRLT